jgi:hypothetical protein
MQNFHAHPVDVETVPSGRGLAEPATLSGRVRDNFVKDATATIIRPIIGAAIGVISYSGDVVGDRAVRQRAGSYA